MHAFIVFLALVSLGSDAYITNHNFQNPRPHEANVVARPFVSHGPVLLAGYFGVSALGVAYADRTLRRHNHKKWAAALVVGTVAVEGYWTAYSVRHGAP